MILSNLRSLNNRIFHRIRLTTKLMVMMLTLLALSLTASVFLSQMAQQALIADIEESIHDLSNATAVSLEQLSGEPDAGQLQKLLSRLVRKGVKEIKLLDVEKEVVASSPPQQTGRKMETTVVKGGQREYNVTAPLVDGTDVLGYIHVTFTLEDLAKANRATLIKRVAVTLLIFALGIAASLYLARKYTQPLHGVVEAAKRVAAGDLTKTIEVEGADEIAELTKSSHEIRNPLNFISLSIDHIRSRLNASRGAGLEETQVLIANIKDEIHRLNDMVENFLTVGKPLALNKTDVDVNVLIRDVVGLAQQKAVEQGIEIHVEGPAAIPRLHVDPAQVKTCLMNVVLNAIQAMPAGGTLAVRVAYRPDGLGNLGREDEKPPGGVEVWVSDTGSGILEEELGKIFNPYFTTKKLGIGLGLAITKKIVEEHGGQICVMSRAHEGTTVVITFPLDQVTEVAV